MNRYKILGYTNPSCSPCGPLVTIVSVDHRIGAIFPDFSFYYLDVSSIDEISNIIIEESDHRYIKKKQYSYLSKDKQIHVLNENLIINLMREDLDAIKNIGDEDFVEIITEMLNIEHERIALMNPFKYLININQVSEEYHIFYTNRNLSNGATAKRLILQQSKKGQYKTFYKKNLWLSNLDDDELCKIDYKRIYRRLKNAMSNIAERAKTNDFKGLLIYA